jgi:siroheme synthase
VENAGRADARILHADLATLGACVEAAAPTGPVLLVIGSVAAMARRPAVIESVRQRRGG